MKIVMGVDEPAQNADLLVLGAQGHGFLERLTTGSVSLDQAVARPYSVIVMRAS